MALQSWRSRSVPLLLAIIFFLIWTPCGTCDTEISSNIEVPTTFRLAQSPYKLAAGAVVTVFAQASLTIEPGVSVMIYKLYLMRASLSAAIIDRSIDK